MWIRRERERERVATVPFYSSNCIDNKVDLNIRWMIEKLVSQEEGEDEEEKELTAARFFFVPLSIITRWERLKIKVNMEWMWDIFAERRTTTRVRSQVLVSALFQRRPANWRQFAHDETIVNFQLATQSQPQGQLCQFNPLGPLSLVCLSWFLIKGYRKISLPVIW